MMLGAGSLTEERLPRVMHCETSRKKRSTRLSQEEVVGAKSLSAWILLQPILDRGVPVGGAFVGNEMDGQVLGGLVVDLLEIGQTLPPVCFSAMVLIRLPSRWWGNCERERSVTNVVLGGGLDVADPLWQPGLRTLQCLALGSLVTAQAPRPSR